MVRASHRRARSVFHSFRFAFQGVFTAFREERNFRVQLLYAALVAVLFFLLRPTLIWTSLAGLSIVLLLSMELVNSALERAVDLACGDTNRLAAEAKDMAAGAVMLTSFGSAAVVLVSLCNSLDTEALLGLGGLFMMSIFYRFKGEAIC